MRVRAGDTSAMISGIAEGGALVAAAMASTLAVAGTVTFDASQANTWTVTLSANVTSSSIINPNISGQTLTIVWLQDATGGRTYVWPTNCKFAGGVAPSDTTVSKQTSVTLTYNGSNWMETARAVAVG